MSKSESSGSDKGTRLSAAVGESFEAWWNRYVKGRLLNRDNREQARDGWLAREPQLRAAAADALEWAAAWVENSATDATREFALNMAMTIRAQRSAWLSGRTPLSAASSSDAPLVTIREDVARFLLGEGPLEGVWWGEINHKRDAPFWWRNPLRVSMHPFAPSSASTSKDCPTCGGDGKLTDQPGTFKDCTTCDGCGKVVPFGNRLLRASYGVSHASSNDRCFDAAFKALEHLDSVRFMWNGPIHQAVALLRAATGPQSARRCEKCGCSWDAPVEACPACGFVPSKRVTDDMVNRFLSWPLPDSVCTDLCTTKANTYPNRIGTNLLTAYEARKMLEHVLETPIAASATTTSEEKKS